MCESWTALWVQTKMVSIDGQTLRFYLGDGQIVSYEFRSAEEVTGFLRQFGEAQVPVHPERCTCA